MKISTVENYTASFEAVVVGVFSDKPPTLNGLPDELQKLVGLVIQHGKVAKLLDSELTFFFEEGQARRLLVIGLGKSTDLDIRWARNVSGAALRILKKKGIQSAFFALPTGLLNPASVFQAFTEGVLLGDYDPGIYKTFDNNPNVLLEEIAFWVDGIDSSIREAVKRGVIIGEATNYARNLANEPASVMTPARLAQQAKEVAGKYGLEIEVLGKKELERGGFNTLLAVGQGSANEPCLIILKYKGTDKNQPYLGLVGKGITFDSGGLNLKPGEGLLDQKMDMSGGAWVIATMAILAQLKPEINVLGLIPAAENMPSGTSYRPGDVIKTLEGKTVEITNTDAEGRLAMADALTYARKLGATRLLDVATLTFSVQVAMGGITTAVFGSDQSFTDIFIKSANEAGELAWQMPLFPDYRETLNSAIADIANSGGLYSGAAGAPLFLKEFTGRLPWLHVDIAGTAYSRLDRPYLARGSSGQIIRTMVDFVCACSQL